MVIDFHSHCFPDALAPRAIEKLCCNAMHTDFSPHTNGTASDTEAKLRAAGIDHAVVCNIATNARQQHNVNSFAISLTERDGMLIPLGSLHPDGEDKRGELARLRAAGIRGIKIHPDYVRFDIDDPGFDEIFTLCAEIGFFVVTHAGLDPVSPDHMHASPRAIANVLGRYPGLRLVAAHMGSLRCAAEVLETLVGLDVYFDTSLSSLRPDEHDTLIKILQNHRPDRLLFGTDTPWSCAADELRFIETAPIPDDLRERILWRNAAELLGLERS